MNGINKKTNKALAEIKEAKKYKRENEIRVGQVPENVRESLYNIAKNLGVPFPSFMKQEFRKILDSYPEKYKLPLQD